jgi:putative hydrolase of the HAD superfamily
MLEGIPEMIFFDAGETLIHPLPSFPELFSAVCADHGLNVDSNRIPGITRRLMGNIEERQEQGFTFTNKLEKSRRFWLDFYTGVVRELGYDREDGELPGALYRVFSRPSNYGAYHDVQDTLEELSGRGFRMGLISNFESWLDDLLGDLGIKRFFEVVIISGREGFEKPHPRIFELALERGGVEPQRALHVGDSPISDFGGASKAGMQAVLLDRWDRFPGFEGIRVTDLREIPPLLD